MVIQIGGFTQRGIPCIIRSSDEYDGHDGYSNRWIVNNNKKSAKSDSYFSKLLSYLWGTRVPENKVT